MPEKQLDRGRLQGRIFGTAVLLVLISLILSFVLYYAVCLKLIEDRSDELDRMFMRTAAERTNRYLGEIAEIVNMAATDPNLEVLLSAGPDEEQDYQLVSAQNEYDRYLRSLILNYEQAENVLLLYGENYFIVHESGGAFYKTQVEDFYRQTAPLMRSGGTSQFYLLNLEGGRKNSVAVLTPIFRQGEKGPVGCIAVVLSEQFATQLRFAGEEVFLVDQLGSSFYLFGGESGVPEADWNVYDLEFGGWKLAAPSFGESIRASFFDNTRLFVPVGAAYLLLSVLCAWYFSRWLLFPLREMNLSLKRLSARREAGGHSGYHVRGKRRMHFRKRLLLFYTVLVLLPVVTSSVCFYGATQRTVDEKIGYFSEHQANFLFDQIRLTLEQYQRTAVELAYNDEVQEYLAGTGQQPSQESAVSRFLLQKQTQVQEIMNIALFSPERELLYSSFYSRHFIDGDFYDGLFAQMSHNAYQTCWGGIEPSEFNRSRITLALTVFSMPPGSGAGQKLGYLFLDFDAAELEGLATDFERQGDSSLFLFDGDGNLLLGEPDTAWDGVLPERVGGRVSRRDSVLFTEQFEDSGWIAAAEIPRQEYLKERTSILLICGAIILLLGLLCFLASYLSSAALSRNLEALVQFVKRIGSGGASERFFPARGSTGDEIEELGQSFNEMLDTLDRLVEQQLESERQYRSSQLAAKQFELNLLQSQINPHFLYNTLKTVQYMVHVQDPRAERMVKLLIHLFRTGISKNERLVTVEEELRHVETYLEIQKIRFSDKFEIVIEADEDVRHLYLLKLTLQPIVENAIYHGLELLDRKGKLSIRAGKADGDLLVTIEDDGNGMSAEKLASVREKLADYQRSKSIGLFNVHERMRLYFGEPYGITLESRLRAGTRVTLRFPVMENPEDVLIAREQ